MKNICHIIAKRGEKELFEMRWWAPTELNDAVKLEFRDGIYDGVFSVVQIISVNVRQNIDEHIISQMMHRTEDA